MFDNNTTCFRRGFILILVLILPGICAWAGDYLSGYIRVLPESAETGEYRIQLHQVTTFGSTD